MNFPKNVIKDRILSSPIDKMWRPEDIRGSFYLSVYKKAEELLEEDGDWDWVNNVITGETLTTKEGLIWGKRLAVLFKQLGFGRSDVVHMVVGNYNLTFSVCFGTWILGGVCSLGDVNLEARAIAKQLIDTKAKLVFCTPETSMLVLDAVNMVEDKSKITCFCFGESDWCENIFNTIKDTSAENCPEPYIAKDPKLEPNLIFWSSGTTGHPKGIVHSHFTSLNLGNLTASMLTPRVPVVATTCFFHVGGFFTGINAFVSRQSLYHMFGTGFKLEQLLNTIKEKRPRQIALGTHHYVQLSESEFLKNSDPDELDSLELIVPAGAAVPQSCKEKFEQKCRNLKGVLNAYGQTETGIACAGINIQHLGTIFPMTRVKIENPDTLERCGPGETGEICLKTPFGRMLYLLGRAKETKEVIDFEGFVHTGDLGFYNEEGELWYVDRMKEIIKYKNNHVSPTELEDILQRHPAVQQSLVFGRPDPTVQELISAVVVLNDGCSATEAELTKFVNDQVTDYKKIRGGIIFRNVIPTNSVGKLVRRHMRDWANAQVTGKQTNGT